MYPLTLSRSEFTLLHCLVRNAGRVVTRTRFEEQLYGWRDGVESNSLEVHIHNLRRKLGKATIRTVRGVGYLLDSPPFHPRRETSPMSLRLP